MVVVLWPKVHEKILHSACLQSVATIYFLLTCTFVFSYLLSPCSFFFSIRCLAFIIFQFRVVFLSPCQIHPGVCREIWIFTDTCLEIYGMKYWVLSRREKKKILSNIYDWFFFDGFWILCKLLQYKWMNHF